MTQTINENTTCVAHLLFTIQMSEALKLSRLPRLTTVSLADNGLDDYRSELLVAVCNLTTLDGELFGDEERAEAAETRRARSAAATAND